MFSIKDCEVEGNVFFVCVRTGGSDIVLLLPASSCGYSIRMQRKKVNHFPSGTIA